MRTYEATLLFKPQIEQDQLNNAIQHAISLVEEKGGLFHKREVLGKRKLGYPIKGEQEAYLVTLAFQLHEERMPEISKSLGQQPDILRHMLGIKERLVAPTPSLPTAPGVKTSAQPPQEQKEKVRIEDIEEKLKEIFKE